MSFKTVIIANTVINSIKTIIIYYRIILISDTFQSHIIAHSKRDIGHFEFEKSISFLDFGIYARFNVDCGIVVILTGFRVLNRFCGSLRICIGRTA